MFDLLRHRRYPSADKRITAAGVLPTGCDSRAGDSGAANAASCVDISGPKIKVGSTASCVRAAMTI
jgi:urea transport system substrate-binding protein